MNEQMTQEKKDDNQAKSNDRLSSQPNDLIVKQGGLLLDKEVMSLSKASNKYYTIFKNNNQVYALLSYVTKGNQQKVKSMPTPMLLLEKTDVTDFPAGRKFKRITAYQYALWARDKRMVRVIEEIACRTRGEAGYTLRTALLQQWNELRQQGLTYSLNGKEHCEIAYNPQPLYDAYRSYRLRYDSLVKQNNYNGLRNLWSEVGKQQRLMPAHAIQELLNLQDYYDPNKFDHEILIRCFSICDPQSKAVLLELPAIVGNQSGLGISFALIRGERRCCAVEAYVTVEEACLDSRALAILFKVRTQELKDKPVLMPPTDYNCCVML